MKTGIIIEGHELAELIKVAVANALPKYTLPLSPISCNEGSDFLKTDQACKYLHCSRPHLHKLQREGHITAYPVGLHNLYKKADLDSYIHSTSKATGVWKGE